MISLQEQLRHRGADHRRVLDRPALPSDWELVGEFIDEVSYVARQSQQVWEPLFGHYYASAWLLAERDGGGRLLPPAFFTWVQELFPGVCQALLTRAQRPPVPPSYEVAGSFVPGVPGQGEALSRAYYELLAVHIPNRTSNGLPRGRLDAEHRPAVTTAEGAQRQPFLNNARRNHG